MTVGSKRRLHCGVLVFVAAAAGLRTVASQIQPEPNPIVTAAAKDITEAAVRRHMAILADDAMQGRETGTPGFDKAADYVSQQFRALKLQELDDAYLQRITLRRTRVNERGSSLAVTTAGQQRTLAYAKEFVTYGVRGRASVSIESQLIYVGDGVSAVARGIDAYRGLNVSGKIVVASPGAPAFLSSSEQSFYSDASHKVENAARHGAAAMLLIDAPQIPWDLRLRSARQLGVIEAIPPLEREPLIPLVYLQRQAAGRIFGQALDSGAVHPGLLLGSGQLSIRQKSRDVRSANVVARLPGHDPQRLHEHIVVMAHLDHVGIADPINGDRIYNGAVDNASGIAALLTIAKAYVALDRRPGRSLIFLATTGEEQGLIGAEYFVRQLHRMPGEIVAAINIDGTSITPFQHLDVRGGSQSSLGESALTAGGQLDIAVRLEPLGVGGSDHSPFLLAGIPPLWVGASLPSDWMRTRYHTPQDDMQQPLNFAAAARYAQFVFLTIYLTADASSRPKWNDAEFFGQKRP